MRVLARAPATVANLGPGFDSTAVALDLWSEVELDTEAGGISIEGEGAGELPADDSNLVVRAMRSLSDETGRALPPFGLRCLNRIPLERGLGSSAAAIAAGLVLADRILEIGSDRLLELAVGLEGHADNVAAALVGGVAIAYSTEGGWRAERLEPAPSLRPVLLVPEGVRVPTGDARRALPTSVPLEDAVFNSSRSQLLVLALTSRPELLADALQERLHQEARLALAPASRDLFETLAAQGIPVCVAGSGPSLLAFETERPVPDPARGWRVIRTSIAARGAELHDA